VKHARIRVASSRPSLVHSLPDQMQGRARGAGAAKVNAPDGRYAQSFEVADMMPLGPHVRRVQLTNYERIARPVQYMDEIQARRHQTTLPTLVQGIG